VKPSRSGEAYCCHHRNGIAERDFPTAAESWQPHKPLAIGISQALIDRDLLPAKEIKLALQVYTSRLQYQRCLIVDAHRIDLDGNNAGEVSVNEAAHAIERIAQIDAGRAETFKAASRARKDAHRQARRLAIQAGELKAREVEGRTEAVES
jgi:sRNA-binding protein